MNIAADLPDTLSLDPAIAVTELQAARAGLVDIASTSTAETRRTLRHLIVIAQGVVVIAGSVQRALMSWMLLYLVLRSLRLSAAGTASLPDGPWSSWLLMFDLDGRSLIGALAILVTVVAVMMVSYRSIWSTLQRAAQDDTVATGSGATAAWLRWAIPVAAIAVVALLAARGVLRADLDRGNRCDAQWDAQTLGRDWWLLRCPAESSGDCTIATRQETRSFPPGHRLIIAAAEVAEVGFERSGCVDALQLAAPESREAHFQPTEVIVPLRFDPADLQQRVSIELTGTPVQPPVVPVPALAGISRQLDRIAQEVHASGAAQSLAIAEAAAAGQFDRRIDALGQLVSQLIGELATANRSARTDLQLRIACEARRRADNSYRRGKAWLFGDKFCRDLLSDARHDAGGADPAAASDPSDLSDHPDSRGTP